MNTIDDAFNALSTIASLAALSAFTTESVASVYSGKAHKCCCGCAGNHRYASRFVDVSTERRGYAVTADESLST